MICIPGVDPGFSFGGGGGVAQKIMCPHAHYERGAEPNSLSARVQGAPKGPGSSKVVLMLSRAI